MPFTLVGYSYKDGTYINDCSIDNNNFSTKSYNINLSDNEKSLFFK